MVAELEGMKPSHLIVRAKAEGITNADIDATVDDEDRKTALVRLIANKPHQQKQQQEQQQKAAAEAAALVAELEGMKPSCLIVRAREEGITNASINATVDDDNRKTALVKLIIAHKQASENRPHMVHKCLQIVYYMHE